jgi:hypothetical protein
MKLLQIVKNVHSGQNKGCLLRIQVYHTAVHLFSFDGGNWQGPSWGFMAPAEYSGPERLGFYGSLLPALSSAVAQWPRWYRFLWKATHFRFCVI